MQKENFFNRYLGSYISYLQDSVKVDGRRLTNADICQRAHISTATLGNVKKG